MPIKPLTGKSRMVGVVCVVTFAFTKCLLKGKLLLNKHYVSGALELNVKNIHIKGPGRAGEIKDYCT